MQPIVPQVFAVGYKAVLAAFRAVRPEVGSPRDPGRPDRALGGIVVEFRLALQLVRDDPFDREARLIGPWFGTSAQLGVAGVGAAGKKGDLQVRELVAQVVQ